MKKILRIVAFWLIVIVTWMICFMLCLFTSCSPPRRVATQDPYNIQVRIMHIEPRHPGWLVTVRTGYKIFQHKYLQLPDSFAIGKVVNMPVFRRIK